MPVLALLLLAALAAGLWLRLLGLHWGARHPFHTDERVYVENVVAMLRAGDLDHRFYTYPGLFFYILALPLWVLGPSHWDGAQPFLIARAVVAAFGAANIALLFFVARRLVGDWAALAAAWMLAVAPLDLRASHEVRPDVLLQGFGILALVVLIEKQKAAGADLWSGLLIGVASAVKFTGLLLVPTYLASRLARRGWRASAGLIGAGAIALTTVLALTPYAVLHASSYQEGPGMQLRMYYGSDPGREIDYLRNVRFYLSAALQSLGIAGTGLVVFGAVLALREDARTWALRLIHPLVVLATMSTAVLVFARLLLPAMGILYMLAGLAVAWLGRRHWLLGLAAALAAILPAAHTSYRFRWYLSQPSARDRAVDWIERNAPRGTVILETRHDAHQGGRAGDILGIDRARYEVVEELSGDRVNLRLAAPEADLVITGPGAGAGWADPLRVLYEARGPRHDLVLQVKAVAPERRPQYRVATECVITPFEEPGGGGALTDGETASEWTTDGPMQGGEEIRVDCPQPVSVGRLELLWGAVTRHGPDIRVLDENGRLLRTVPLRPPVEEQLAWRARGSPRPLGDVYVLAGRPVRSLVIRQTGRRPDPWRIRELRVLERQPAETPSPPFWTSANLETGTSQ